MISLRFDDGIASVFLALSSTRSSGHGSHIHQDVSSTGAGYSVRLSSLQVATQLVFDFRSWE